jgi:hypothetical protein
MWWWCGDLLLVYVVVFIVSFRVVILVFLHLGSHKVTFRKTLFS